MKVLVACEESQAVTIEFRKLGIEAFSCDIQECSGGHPEWHFQQDVFEIINMGWDMMIGHPPCTYLSFAGNSYLNIEKYGDKAIARKNEQLKAIEFFKKLYSAPINYICLENPIGYIMQHIKYDQIIHPYYFGDRCSKRTVLWLKNLPKLYHNSSINLFDQNITHVDKGEMCSSGSVLMWGPEVLKMNNEDRKKFRSKTFHGIAKAMATQWSKYIQTQEQPKKPIYESI